MDICYYGVEESGFMKFTDNFSEELQSKAEFLEQIDINVEKERVKLELLKQISSNDENNILKIELIEQIVLYATIIENNCRKKGMNERAILVEIKNKMLETFFHYQNSVESLENGLRQLKMLNEMYAEKEEINGRNGR